MLTKRKGPRRSGCGKDCGPPGASTVADHKGVPTGVWERRQFNIELLSAVVPVLCVEIPMGLTGVFTVWGVLDPGHRFFFVPKI